MKSLFFSLACFCILLLGACKQQPKYGAPVGAPRELVATPLQWINYKTQYLQFYKDFTALDTAGAEMDKAAFFKRIAEEAYFPLRMHALDTGAYYKLQRIDFPTAPATIDIIQDWARRAYKYQQMEGKMLPGFSYTDLNGKTYDAVTMKNKFVALKFWFISCVPCIAEMPALNKLVEKYSNRNDVAFVSLAFDSQQELKDFLTRIRFDYAVVADKKDYLLNELRIDGYPTHMVLNREGKVIKVVEDEKQLEYVLTKVLGEN